MDCPRCHGEKSLKVPAGKDHNGRPKFFLTPCDECGGTGQVKR